MNSLAISRRRLIRVIAGAPIVYGSLAALAADAAKAQSAHSSAKGTLIEACSFADFGGWKLDTQFLDQMGGNYLLAHGMGIPMGNAKTTIEQTTTGKHRVWVRTKDWCPGDWDSPGQFKVHVNGKALEPVFGADVVDKNGPSGGWGWQDGGVIDLPQLPVPKKKDKRNLAIELEDLTGFAGRCDAIYLTTDLDETPPTQTEEVLAWKDKLTGRNATPFKAYDFDVVIVGGGIAGCAAALVADEQGLNVGLIQDRPIFGGNASSEIRVHTLGIYGQGERILRKLDTKTWQNGSEEAHADQRKRDQNMVASGVKSFVNQRAVGLEAEGKKILAVDSRDAHTGLIRRFRAPVFIDCSGDGVLGHWAGAETRYGREAADEFDEAWDKHGELWSPTKPDSKVMGTSVMWNTGEADEAVYFPEVPWAMPVAKKHTATRGDWNWEYTDDDLNQIDDGEQIRDHMYRAIYGTFANAKKDPKNARLELTWVAHISGRRESRRIMGDYVYSMKDASEERTFEDTVVVETRPIDVHFQMKEVGGDVDFRSEALFMGKWSDFEYYLPFRSFYSKDINNLMMAGRCFSCTHIGLGGPRVQNTTGQMGIATGYAAVLCKKHNASPRKIGQKHIKELRALIGYESQA